MDPPLQHLLKLIKPSQRNLNKEDILDIFIDFKHFLQTRIGSPKGKSWSVIMMMCDVRMNRSRWAIYCSRLAIRYSTWPPEKKKNKSIQKIIDFLDKAEIALDIMINSLIVICSVEPSWSTPVANFHQLSMELLKGMDYEYFNKFQHFGTSKIEFNFVPFQKTSILVMPLRTPKNSELTAKNKFIAETSDSGIQAFGDCDQNSLFLHLYNFQPSIRIQYPYDFFINNKMWMNNKWQCRNCRQKARIIEEVRMLVFKELNLLIRNFDQVLGALKKFGKKAYVCQKCFVHRSMNSHGLWIYGGSVCSLCKDAYLKRNISIKDARKTIGDFETDLQNMFYALFRPVNIKGDTFIDLKSAFIHSFWVQLKAINSSWPFTVQEEIDFRHGCSYEIISYLEHRYCYQYREFHRKISTVQNHLVEITLEIGFDEESDSAF